MNVWKKNKGNKWTSFLRGFFLFVAKGEKYWFWSVSAKHSNHLQIGSAKNFVAARKNAIAYARRSKK